MRKFSNEAGVKSDKAEGFRDRKAIPRMKQKVDRRKGRRAGRK